MTLTILRDILPHNARIVAGGYEAISELTDVEINKTLLFECNESESEFPTVIIINFFFNRIYDIEGSAITRILIELAKYFALRLDCRTVCEGTDYGDKLDFPYYSIIWDRNRSYLADDCNSKFFDDGDKPVRIIKEISIPNELDLKAYMEWIVIGRLDYLSYVENLLYDHFQFIEDSYPGAGDSYPIGIESAVNYFLNNFSELPKYKVSFQHVLNYQSSKIDFKDLLLKQAGMIYYDDNEAYRVFKGIFYDIFKDSEIMLLELEQL